MRIGSLDKVNQVYTNKINAAYKTAPAMKKDEVQISEEALEIGSAFKKVQEAPDVRMDKVNALKEQIQNGTYNVSARSVSEKILSQLSM